MKNLLKVLKPTPNKVWFGVSRERQVDMFTRAIQKFQGTEYSHALAIYYSMDLDDFIITNAHGVGVQLDLLRDFYLEAEVTVLFERDVNKTQRHKFIKRVVELDGVKYSDKQILGIGIARLFKSKKSIFQNKDDEMICSEYADQLSIACGLPSACAYVNKGRELLSPKDNVVFWNHMATVSSYDKTFRRIELNVSDRP